MIKWPDIKPDEYAPSWSVEIHYYETLKTGAIAHAFDEIASRGGLWADIKKSVAGRIDREGVREGWMRVEVKAFPNL